VDSVPEPHIPVPDDVIHWFLVTVFGSGSVIVVLYIVGNSLWSWYGVLKTGVKAGQIGAARLKQVPGRLFALGPFGVLLGFVLTVVVLCLQALWLGLSYLIGNGLSWFFVGRPGMRNGPDWKAFVATLRWDAITQIYVVAALIVLALAYAAAYRPHWQDRADRAVTVLTIPLMFIGGICGLGAALAGILYVMQSISHDHEPYVQDFGLKTLALVAISVAYIVASHTIAATPALIARVWRPVPARLAAPGGYPYYPY